MKKVFKKPRITTKRLNTRVHFYKYTENNGPEAGEKEEAEKAKLVAEAKELGMSPSEIASMDNVDEITNALIPFR